MQADTIAKIVETLKAERIDLVVTLPEEPTSSLTETIRRDPYFTSIAGLLVGTWSLAQMGVLYGIPVLIMASYRGDIGDRSGVSGAQLFMFQQLGEPMLNTLRIPYRVIKKNDELEREIRDSHFACREYGTPLVLLLTGEVLW